MAGNSTLLEASISARASICASTDSGTWTAIWSPSKSALKAGADQRVELDRLAFDQDRLEGLDAQTVQRRGAVQQHRVLLDDLFQDVPDHRRAGFDFIFLAALMVVAMPMAPGARR